MMRRSLRIVKVAVTVVTMTSERRPRGAVEKGPTSARLANNVRELRKRRRLLQDDLAERMAELGRPILKSGLSKLEKGERRVDVDDLMALALALEVTPNRLLLTEEADDEEVELTEGYTTNRRQAWAWSCGEWAEGSRFPFAYFSGGRVPAFRFQTENRPHDPPRRLSAEEFGELRGWQKRLEEILFEMRDSGAPDWMFEELKKSSVYFTQAAAED